MKRPVETNVFYLDLNKIPFSFLAACLFERFRNSVALDKVTEQLRNVLLKYYFRSIKKYFCGTCHFCTSEVGNSDLAGLTSGKLYLLSNF